jgi:hypothetical protein
VQSATQLGVREPRRQRLLELEGNILIRAYLLFIIIVEMMVRCVRDFGCCVLFFVNFRLTEMWQTKKQTVESLAHQPTTTPFDNSISMPQASLNAQRHRHVIRANRALPLAPRATPATSVAP